MRDVAIDRIMTTQPVFVGPDDSIVEAQIRLQSNSINHLPVVEDGRLVGMLSASDMLRVALLDERSPLLKSIRVRKLMRENPQVIPADASLRQAAEALSDGSFHALPVVQPDMTLVGILTSTDLIRHLLQHIPTGDGSLRMRALDSSAIESVGADVMAIVDRVKQAREDGCDLGDVENALLTVHKRNLELYAVYRAAQHYVHSGHADREHSVLIKCLSEASESGSELTL